MTTSKGKANQIVYSQVAAELRKRIIGGEFSNGKLPSERKLAEEYHINRITLRKAIDLLLKERVVHRLSNKGTFVGRKPKTAKLTGNKIIGFVLVGRDSIDSFHSGVLLNLERFIKKNHFQLMFFSISSARDVDNALQKAIDADILDGIIFSGLISPEIARKVRNLGVATILLGHLTYSAPVENKFDRIIVDSLDYSFRATEYLIRNGCKNIALVNGPSYKVFLNIYQGYMKALETATVPYREELVVKCDAENQLASYKGTTRILDSYAIDGIFVANERLAPGVVEALKNHGLKTPDDIKLITVGSTHSGFSNLHKLAMVDINIEEIAKKSLSLLIERMTYPDKRVKIKYINFKIKEL